MERMHAPAGGEPYCSNCGYVLTGLVESSKCPECGRPIVEILTRTETIRVRSVRYTSAFTLFGVPAIQVASGPRDGETHGRARGIIAVGDIATGGIAIGPVACGIVALGGLSLGIASVGGFALALLTAIGGFAAGGFANGGCAIGLVANGGGAVGVIAQGGAAFGIYARGGNRTRPSTPSDLNVFSRWSWLLGDRPSARPTLWAAGVPLALAAIIGTLVLIRYITYEGPPTETKFR